MKAVPAVEAGPIAAPAPQPQPERPKLKSVTAIAASMSGRVTRPMVEAKPAPAKVEAKPAAKVELKPLRPIASLKPIENRPLPSLRPLGTRPMEAQKPVEASKPIATSKPIEAPKPAAILAKPIEAAKPAPRPAPVKPIAPLKPILAAELPPLPQMKLPGMPPAQARATTSGRLAEGSIPPPTSQAASRPLPSLFSVIDRKRPAQAAAAPRAAAPRAHDMSRPKVAARVVAGALTAVAPLASASAAPPATTSQSAVMAKQAVELDEPDYIPLTADDLIEDAIPELLAQDDFIPMDLAVTPAPLPPPPRVGQGSGVSFSALEESFFAAGEELDTAEEAALEPETFDDLPPVERAGFWSRLRANASARE